MLNYFYYYLCVFGVRLRHTCDLQLESTASKTVLLMTDQDT